MIRILAWIAPTDVKFRFFWKGLRKNKITQNYASDD
jgi:hypothetical protein